LAIWQTFKRKRAIAPPARPLATRPVTASLKRSSRKAVCWQRINPCPPWVIVADPVAKQASALRLSVSATACWLQIMLRGRLVRENFDDRTAPKPPSLPRRIEIAPHRQDDHIQKRTLFKPNEGVVHLQSHELLSSLMDISINPILFISCLVHHEAPGR
jgi:hypothetical protein